MKTLIQYGLICFVSVILFDVAAYFTGIKEQYFPTIKGRMTYPDGYFKADPVLGHDIVPNHAPIEFDWRDSKAQIFSNQYGCFDKNEHYKEPVIYVSGDSMAWGYADYEKKYGTIIENKLGVTVAKCGVTHSGQKHQLQKLKKWIQDTGIVPKAVLLIWISNDTSNDFLYPQATVIKGKFVDQVTLSSDEKGHAVRAHVPEIEKKLEMYLEENNDEQKSNAHNYSVVSQIIAFFKEYSTSANIARKSLDKYIGSSLRVAVEKQKHVDLTAYLKDANFKALENFISFTKQKSITLVVLTYGGSVEDTNDVYSFLKAKTQHVINFPEVIKEKKINFSDLIWKIDGHPNEAGNQLVAEIYLDYLEKHNILETTP